MTSARPPGGTGPGGGPAREVGEVGEVGGVGRGQGPDASRGSWRAHIGAAARARSIPLATIVTTVAVVFIVLDLNALLILLLWVLRTVVLYVVIATFIALVL